MNPPCPHYGKISYSDRKRAITARNQIIRSGRGVGPPLTVFHCPCGSYHLGREWGSRQGERKRRDAAILGEHGGDPS